jgi:GNAT superfamily N-acetyltransferase
VTATDLDLHIRLELAELDALEDMGHAATADAAAACGLHVFRQDGVLGTLATNADVLVLNRIVGLGVSSPATEEALEAALAPFHERRVPRVFVHIHPLAQPHPLAALLEARGMRHRNNWVRLVRDTSPPNAAASPLAVRPVTSGDAIAWASAIATSFRWPESTVPWIACLPGRPGWHCFGSFDGSTLAGTGALHVAGDIGWLSLATTLPRYRRRGSQSALLARRIGEAARLGCRWLSVEAAEGTPSAPSPSIHNLHRAGFTTAYTRANFLLVPRPAAALWNAIARTFTSTTIAPARQ